MKKKEREQREKNSATYIYETQKTKSAQVNKRKKNNTRVGAETGPSLNLSAEKHEHHHLNDPILYFTILQQYQ